jgi:hypothetical protein
VVKVEKTADPNVCGVGVASSDNVSADARFVGVGRATDGILYGADSAGATQ